MSHRIGPEPQARRAGLAFNSACVGLALLEVVRPSALAGLACILTPFVALAIARMDDRFCLLRDGPGAQADLGGFAAPLLALALWAATAQHIVDPAVPLIAAAGLAALLSIALIKTDLETRRAHFLGALVGFSLAWAWGALIYVNVTFDRSSPIALTGTGVSTHARGSRCGVQVEYSGRRQLMKWCQAGLRPGDLASVEAKQGALGWPYLRQPAEPDRETWIVSGRLAARASSTAAGA